MISETIYAFICLHSRLNEDSAPPNVRAQKREEWHQRLSNETGIPLMRLRILLTNYSAVLLPSYGVHGWRPIHANGYSEEQLQEMRKKVQLTVDEAERLVLALAPAMEQLEKSLELFQKMSTLTNESGRQVLNFIMRKNDEKTRN